ncbi:MAG: hypothetical protein AAGB01_11785 [Cyanobacteria bacterium P01_F01_bin.42]
MFDQLDQLVEQSPSSGAHTLAILVILVGLEAVLSADNAIALASLVKGLKSVELERRALNIGLIAAFVMRMALIFAATWVIKYWQFELIGALYLLWLAGKYFIAGEEDESGEGRHQFSSLWQLVPLIAITDLAFSLDSVTTAIALADDRWLVISGGIIGIIALRFLAELFIRWLDEFKHLQDAGYLTVVLVGLRLLLRVVNESYVLPEWLMITLIALTFAWGFSERIVPDAAQVETIETTESTTVSLPTETLQAESLQTETDLRDPEPASRN